MAEETQAGKFRFCPVCASPLMASTVDREERVMCSNACGFVHWNNPVPVVAALVLHEGDAILVRQEKWPEGWYGLVTGFLEQIEEPASAAAREVQEELSLRVLSTQWIGNYAFAEQNQVLLAYALACDGEIVLSEELAQYKRVPVSALKPWSFGTGRAVHDWIQRQNTAA
jgi:NADH pyrophosphatase NudC (nudix superfamily)